MESRLALCLLITCCLATIASAAGSSALNHEGYLRQWTIIGPFANPERAQDAKDRGAFDVDYLQSIGGEAKAKMGLGITVGYSQTTGSLSFKELV